MKRLIPLMAVVTAVGLATPVLADEDEGEGAGATFALRYGYELQNWSLSNAAGTSLLTFGTPMHTFTVTDLSGMVIAAVLSVAGTEGNRRMAEDEARRNDKTTYTYAMREAEPHEGLLLGMTIGLGSSSGFGGSAVPTGTTTADASLFRLAMGSDLFSLLGGTFNWDTSFGYYGLSMPPGSGSALSFSSTAVPVGLSYRWALPVPLVSILVEPSAHIDWRYLLGGLKGQALYDYGVTAAYVLDPQWQIEARYGVGTQPQAGTVPDAAANLTTMTVGTTMSF